MITSAKKLNDRYETALAAAKDTSPNLEEISMELVALSELGCHRATYALGTWYLHGKYFKQDQRKAVKLFRSAAENKIPEAAYDLATSYASGIGIAKNEELAFEYYVKAALLGDLDAHEEVERCYWHGAGVKRNRRISKMWGDKAERMASKK